MGIRLKIKHIDFSEIEKQNFKPEPHTVALIDEGDWWAVVDENENILSVTCVCDRHGGKYFCQTFTPKEYRKNGYCTKLLNYLSKKVYKNDKLIAHCLKASVHCYFDAGFELTKIRPFKHGTQYYMIREVE